MNVFGGVGCGVVEVCITCSLSDFEHDSLMFRGKFCATIRSRGVKMHGGQLCQVSKALLPLARREELTF